MPDETRSSRSSKPKALPSRIYVERNSQGGWSLRLSEDEEPFGNYPSSFHAERVARSYCQQVIVLDEPGAGAHLGRDI